MTTVLVVDDEREMVDLVALGLKRRGFAPVAAGSGAEALVALTHHDVDVVVTDLNMKGMSGLELCQAVAADRPDIPVIVLTAFGSFETAVGAIRAGAYDFVTKPVEIEALAIAVRRAGEHRALRGEVKRLQAAVALTRGAGELVGGSPAMHAVYRLIEQVSPTDTTVLITGETGTGKELVAREIHRAGKRASAPFITLECAAAHDERFAQTLASATGGALFLDEVADLPAVLQSKLLAVLQDRSDVRVIAATSRDLEEMVEERQFRDDLYYKLNVVHVPLPPLRARGGDILLLAQRFVGTYAALTGKQVVGITAAAAERLTGYEWPGNVRELASCMERAVAMTRFEELQADDLPDKVRATSKRTLSGTELTELLTLEEIERRHVLRVLEACNGNRTDAAKMLGLDRKTLYRKLLRWGVGE